MTQKISFLLKIGITTLLLWGLFHAINYQKIEQSLRTFPLSYSVISIACFWIIQGFMAQRWSFILHSQHRFFSFFFLLKSVFIGHLFNQGLPSSIGGDAYRIMAIYTQKTPLSLSFHSVLFERLIGFLGLGFLSFICIPSQLSLILTSFLFWPTVFTHSLVFGLLICLMFFYFINIPILKHSKILYKLNLFINFLKTFVRCQKFFNLTLFVSLFISFFSVFNCMILLKGLGISLTFLQSYLIFPIAFIISSLPISLGGWGVREGILVILLGVFKIAPEQALAFSVLYGILQLLSALPGLLFWFLSFKTSDTSHDLGSKAFSEPIGSADLGKDIS